MVKININEMTIMITLYGKLKENFDWLYWLEYCKSKILQYDYKPTHIEFKSETIKNKGILQINRTTNISKILNSINNKEEIEYLNIYSYPKGFKYYLFDYAIYIGISKKYNLIRLVLEKDLYLKLQRDDIINELKQFIELDNGKIFEMNRKDYPFGYNWDWKDIFNHNTIKILYTF